MRKVLFPFGNLAVIPIPGAAHGLATPFLEVTLWDTQRAPWVRVGAAVEVDPVTYDVLVTTAEPLSGVVVLIG